MIEFVGTILINSHHVCIHVYVHACVYVEVCVDGVEVADRGLRVASVYSPEAVG